MGLARRRHIVCWGLILGVLAGSSTGLAQSPGEIQAARDLFAKAEQDEDAGNWAAALEKLRRAASVKVTPGIRYHLGLCEERLGQLAAALNDYSGAEALAREQRNKDVLDVVADPIKSLKTRVPTLSVEAPAGVEGLSIDVDGKPFPSGLWGIATPMDPGTHQIEARAPGKNAFSASLTLKERDGSKLVITLSDAPKAADAPRKTPDPTPSPVPVGPPSVDTATIPPGPDAPAPERGRSRAAAIVTTVTAVALGGFGVAAYLVADGQQSDAQSGCATLAQPTCTANQGSIRLWDRVALGSWIGAGVFAVTSIVLWALPSGKGSAATARLQLRPDGLVVGGSFQ